MTVPASPPTLSAAVAEIADHIFDQSDLAATSQTPRSHSRCLAVIVLAHAAIEEAIEVACRSAVSTIVVHAKPDFHFLAWGLSSADPKSPSEKDFAKQLKAKSTVSHLAEEYLGVIDRSNGIKEKNLGKLLLPLGIDLDSLQVDVKNLDDFGDKRGNAAHLSPLKARLVELPSAVKTRAINAARSGENVVLAVSAAAHAVASNSLPARVRPSLAARVRRWLGR